MWLLQNIDRFVLSFFVLACSSFLILSLLRYKKLARYVFTWVLRAVLGGIVAALISIPLIFILMYSQMEQQGGLVFFFSVPCAFLITMVGILAFSVFRLGVKRQQLLVREEHSPSWLLMFVMMVLICISVYLMFISNMRAEWTIIFLCLGVPIMLIVVYVSEKNKSRGD